MDSVEHLENLLRKERAHAQALSEAYNKSTKELVQTQAQVRYIRECAELRLKEAAKLIDALHDRIESMVDDWQAQIRNKFNGSEEEKEIALAEVEPYRPERISEDPGLREGKALIG